MYTPVNLLSYIKMGFNWVKIVYCFRDAERKQEAKWAAGEEGDHNVTSITTS